MGVPKSGVIRGERWMLAPSLTAMEAQADLLAPRRRRSSDGSIGDAAHAARKSDHNPDEEGPVDIVDALDISHDPAGGMDIHARARTIAARRDARIDYIISNNMIWSHDKGWKPYTGSNPHTLHAHFSVKDSGRFDTSPWFNSVVNFPTHPQPHEIEEEFMYLRDPKTGAIFAFSETHYDHLTGPQWADRLKEGARAIESNGGIIFHMAKSRIPAK